MSICPYSVNGWYRISEFRRSGDRWIATYVRDDGQLTQAEVTQHVFASGNVAVIENNIDKQISIVDAMLNARSVRGACSA